MQPKQFLFTLLPLAALLAAGCAPISPAQANPLAAPTSTAAPSSPPASLTATPDAAREFKEIKAAFTQALKTTGWIRQVSTRRTFNEQTQAFNEARLFEEWFRLDANGKYVEGYTWVTGPDGALEQESCFINGRLYNVTSAAFSRGDAATEIDFTGGFSEGLKTGLNSARQAVEYQGADAWKFTYEAPDGALTFIHAIYFNRADGRLAGKETWLKESDGTARLVSEMVIQHFEVDADPPLEHFQQIASQVPQ